MIPEQFKPPKGLSGSLTRRWDGPFVVIGRVGKVAYRLQLPRHMYVHPVFHVSQLRPYFEDKEDPSRNQPTRAPANVVDRPELVVEKVLEMRRRGIGTRFRTEFLVHWKGQPSYADTWERAESLWSVEEKIWEFLAKNPQIKY
ncbi:hypothetical protein KI387_044184 [Taxus chinensis]|uniref:Chromo domain-containing protein n=1 Tax=Taxus chinensis TaxID=29808 RepID=A0AA38F6S1_TAXCH|nr:hypothetical protein KI387_044184 [Taxus chinensis]